MTGAFVIIVSPMSNYCLSQRRLVFFSVSLCVAGWSRQNFSGARQKRFVWRVIQVAVPGRACRTLFGNINNEGSLQNWGKPVAVDEGSAQSVPPHQSGGAQSGDQEALGDKTVGLRVPVGSVGLHAAQAGGGHCLWGGQHTLLNNICKKILWTWSISMKIKIKPV